MTIFPLGVTCLLPIHCMPERKKSTIRSIIEDGLGTILLHAEKKNIWIGGLTISKKRQDQLDPYLAAFYNTYR